MHYADSRLPILSGQMVSLKACLMGSRWHVSHWPTTSTSWDHLALQERLIGRLKHPDQFQGARYELAMAATMIRAGFDLEYEMEAVRRWLELSEFGDEGVLDQIARIAGARAAPFRSISHRRVTTPMPRTSRNYYRLL
jgi:hypothetical protein